MKAIITETIVPSCVDAHDVLCAFNKAMQALLREKHPEISGIIYSNMQLVTLELKRQDI